MAARLDLTIDKGSTFERVFTWKTKNPSTGVLEPVDLTGYSARLMMREEHDSPQPFISLTSGVGGITITPELGELKVVIPADVSAAISSTAGVWDLEVYSGTYVKRLLEGKVKLRPEVTR